MDSIQLGPRFEMLAKSRSLSRKRSIGGSRNYLSDLRNLLDAHEPKLYPGKLENEGYYIHRGMKTPKPHEEDLDIIASLLLRVDTQHK